MRKIKLSRNTDITNIDVIKDIVGVREHMEPLYKNFPEDVMNTTEGEMYVASLTYFLRFSMFVNLASSFLSTINLALKFVF